MKEKIEVYKEKLILSSLEYSSLVRHHNWYLQARQLWNNHHDSGHFQVQIGELSASREETRSIKERFSKQEWESNRNIFDSKHLRGDQIIWQYANFNFTVLDLKDDLRFPHDKSGHAYKEYFFTEIYNDNGSHYGIPSQPDLAEFTASLSLNEKEFFLRSADALWFEKYEKYRDDLNFEIQKRTGEYEVIQKQFDEYELLRKFRMGILHEDEIMKSRERNIAKIKSLMPSSVKTKILTFVDFKPSDFEVREYIKDRKIKKEEKKTKNLKSWEEE